ncbi:NAD(P)/FAD-dependent oxidoreductase [soil metagenome]
MPEAIVIGAGHNGLVCACYLARAGLDVLVLEQADEAGGGSRTVETVPGYRFDTHSVAHNIINMTDIPAELDLAGAGLVYRQMDPFAVSVRGDGRIVRFHRDVDATVASLAETAPHDAFAYAGFMERALPVIDAVMLGIDAGAGPRRALSQLPSRARGALLALTRNGGPTGLARLLVAPYARLLAEHLHSDVARAPVAAFAAHSSASPAQTGSSMYSLWQAAYHRFGQWHAVGGAQGLVDALVTRLESYGGRVRTSANVQRIVREAGRVRGVSLDSGEQLGAPVVVSAIDPRSALLELLDPPLVGAVADELRATHRGNAVQMLVHVATTALPAYPSGRPGDWNGLQSHVNGLDDLVAGFAAAEARRLPPDPVPTYAFTTSALDDTLAPAGHHTVYLACPSAPFDLEGGWSTQADGFAERMLDVVEARAPGFRDTIVGTSVRTPEQMAAELRWPGAHPMVLDITIDQLAWLRPTQSLSRYHTPVRGLFLSGAGTAPTGGVAGSPGRGAAKAVLRRHGTPP